MISFPWDICLVFYLCCSLATTTQMPGYFLSFFGNIPLTWALTSLAPEPFRHSPLIWLSSHFWFVLCLGHISHV